jgi:uncharacterized repeat protein (TIGR01451 family)
LRAVALALGVCALAGAAPAAAAPFVYVVNQDDGDVSQFDAPLSGFESLNPLSPATVLSGSFARGVAVTPNGTNLYVANVGDNTVSQYGIDRTTGALSPGSPATVASGPGAFAVAVSPDGKSVYVTDVNALTLSQYNVDPTSGVLSPKSPATVATGTQPWAVAVNPDGKSAYVVNQGDDTISQYNVDPSTGVLSPKSPATVATGMTPTALALSPDGTSAYVTNGTDNTVSQYSVDPATGALTPKSPATVASGSQPNGVAVSPGGKSAYVVSDGDLSVVQYDIDPNTGTLSANSSGTAPTGVAPFAPTITPDGKSLYVSNERDGTVSQYSIDPTTGTLSPKAPATAAVGNAPVAVAVAPDADVSTTVSAPASAFVGTDLTYTVELANLGPSNAWQTSFTDNLPYGTAFVSVSPDTGSCTTPKVGTKGGTVSCELGTIASGANVSTQIVVQVAAKPSQGSLNHTATATSVTPDPYTSNNVGTAQTTVTKRATVTTLTCEFTTVSSGESDPCVVTVTDNSSPPVTPSGTVKLTSSDSSDQFSPNPCTLSGSGGVSTCDLSFTAAPASVGTHKLAASYPGDKYHSASKGKLIISVGSG